MSKERIISKEEFEVYYKTQIAALRARLGETIGRILSSNSNSMIKINLVNSGTCVSYINEKIKQGNFIDYKEFISLNIGYEEMMYMYENCNFNIFDAFNKLVTHEFLHVLFGDFNKTKLTRAYNYVIGSIEKDKLESDPYYEYDPTQKYDRNGYKRINHELFNIAGDFVINRELDINKPFLRAENFDLDPDLNIFQYYSILMKDPNIVANIESFITGKSVIPWSVDENGQPNNGQGGLNGESYPNFTNENLDGESTGMDQVPVSDQKMMQISDEDLLDDLFMGKGRGLGPGNLEFVIKSLKKKDSIFISQTKEIINEIKDDLFNNQDIGVNKITSWFKYNNRRDDTDIVTPGKVKEKDEESKDTEKRSIPIIFVDCSGSMMDILKELFYFCYNLLSYISCTIVFYDDRIIKVINSANSLNFDVSMFGAGGGTNIKGAIEEYKRNYNENINNVYVFTDGYDDFSDIDVTYLSVYDFSKAGIKKHPI